MADPRSRRGRILVNLQRQLETITAANGYAQQVYKVTSNVKNWFETPAAETPVIYIVDEETSPQYHAGKLVEWEWRIGLFGVMRDKTQVQMEEFISDIQDCLFANGTLSFDGIAPGPCAQIRMGNIITDNQLFSEVEGSQLFKVQIVVKYSASAFTAR
jgi:hypothetical protein